MWKVSWDRVRPALCSYWVVQSEDEDGRLGELVVAGGDAGHPLHAARVPELQLELPLLGAVHLAVVIQSHRGLAVCGRGEGVTHEPPKQGGLSNPELTAQDHFL